jgi:hypothetical protein
MGRKVVHCCLLLCDRDIPSDKGLLNLSAELSLLNPIRALYLTTRSWELPHKIISSFSGAHLPASKQTTFNAYNLESNNDVTGGVACGKVRAELRMERTARDSCCSLIFHGLTTFFSFPDHLTECWFSWYATRRKKRPLICIIFQLLNSAYTYNYGPDSSVGIATGYRLDGPEIESLWMWNFPHLSRQALGLTQPPVQ